MAMRGRSGAGTGAGGPGTWPVYDDFKPNSEWQQDAHSHSLIVSLPGFMKEQLRVSTEGRNMIRVRGERLLVGNKWSRFLEDYEVPENSDMNSVRAKFHEGALTVTIPKKIVDKLHDFAPETKDIGTSHVERQGPTHDDQSKKSISSKQKHTGTWSAGDEKKTVAKEERKSEGSNNMEGEEKFKPKRDEGATIKGKGREGKKEGITELSRAEHRVGEKGQEGQKKEVTESSRAEHKAWEKEREGEKKEVTESSQAEHGAKEKGKEGKKKDVVEWSRAEDGALAKAVKGVSELSEERRLMVNMGVAVLVIASLSAYVTYKFVANDDN